MSKFFYLGPDGKLHTMLNPNYKLDRPIEHKVLRSLLWVAAWIIAFPIPATILLNKTKRMKRAAAITATVGLWILYLSGLAFGVLIQIY